MIINYEDYSRALYELSEEENITDNVFEELLFIKDMLCENPEFIKLLDSPAVSAEKRILMIDETFKDASDITVKFMKLLTEMRQMCMFSKCADVFGRFYDEARGILRPVIITAVEISDERCARICEKIAAATGKKIIPVKKIDSSIIGGVILRYDGTQLDGSVASRLSDVRKQLADVVL